MIPLCHKTSMLMVRRSRQAAEKCWHLDGITGARAVLGPRGWGRWVPSPSHEGCHCHCHEGCHCHAAPWRQSHRCTPTLSVHGIDLQPTAMLPLVTPMSKDPCNNTRQWGACTHQNNLCWNKSSKWIPAKSPFFSYSAANVYTICKQCTKGSRMRRTFLGRISSQKERLGIGTSCPGKWWVLYPWRCLRKGKK